MKDCQSCVNWSFTHEDYPKKFGICSSIDVQDDVRFAKEDDESTIYTESCFSCCWYDSGKELAVAKIEIPK